MKMLVVNRKCRMCISILLFITSSFFLGCGEVDDNSQQLE